LNYWGCWCWGELWFVACTFAVELPLVFYKSIWGFGVIIYLFMLMVFSLLTKIGWINFFDQRKIETGIYLYFLLRVGLIMTKI
jgi:hypothetical protein